MLRTHALYDILRRGLAAMRCSAPTARVNLDASWALSLSSISSRPSNDEGSDSFYCDKIQNRERSLVRDTYLFLPFPLGFHLFKHLHSLPLLAPFYFHLVEHTQCLSELLLICHFDFSLFFV